MTKKQTLPETKLSKEEREKQVLFRLVQHYIETGKPVGSNTLKEVGFDQLSAATIRNYLAKLEQEGFLRQHHVSGGRSPTEKAFRFFAKEVESDAHLPENCFPLIENLRQTDTREISTFFQRAAEELSQMTNGACFLSIPRFDQDRVLDLKLLPLDAYRALGVIVTDFGVIRTEVLHTNNKLSAHAAKRMEHYFHWRLTGNDKPEELTKEEEQIAKRFYNELLVRFIISHTHYSEEEILRTGFSHLLTYPEYQTATELAAGLSLFENAHSMRLILRDCISRAHLKYWIGDDLLPYTSTKPNCAILAIPYFANQACVGAVGILGPMRLPYRELFGILHAFSAAISEMITRNLYKHKIHYRHPREQKLLENTPKILLEAKQEPS